MASTRLPRFPVTPASNTILLDDRRFHDLLPDEEWGRLPLAIWRRFSKRFADGETVVYVGTIEEANFSRGGWWLAQLARVIGGPLPTGAETGVPILPNCEHHPDLLRQQPPRDEHERRCRGGVEPLRVVDEAEHRAALGKLREE